MIVLGAGQVYTKGITEFSDLEGDLYMPIVNTCRERTAADQQQTRAYTKEYEINTDDQSNTNKTANKMIHGSELAVHFSQSAL